MSVKKLGLALAQKHFAKSADMVMFSIFVREILKYKKYDNLNAYEMLDVLIIALDRVGEFYSIEDLNDAFLEFAQSGLK